MLRRQFQSGKKLDKSASKKGERVTAEHKKAR